MLFINTYHSAILNEMEIVSFSGEAFLTDCAVVFWATREFPFGRRDISLKDSFVIISSFKKHLEW